MTPEKLWSWMADDELEAAIRLYLDVGDKGLIRIAGYMTAELDRRGSDRLRLSDG
jgi:hypothetical protein